MIKSSSMEQRDVNNIDPTNTKGHDLVEEGINCGFLEATPGMTWYVVSNQTHVAVSDADMNKTLKELGFKDGDTIRLVAKGEAAAGASLLESSNMERRDVEDLDFATVTAHDLVEEAINCGFLETKPGMTWFVVSNQTHVAVPDTDMNKTLEELGFKDGDTIRLVAKGEAAAGDSGLMVSGGKTPETIQTERLIRDAGITDLNTTRLLMAKSSLISRFFPSAQQRIVNDFKKDSVKESSDFYLRLCKLSHNAQLQALTERFNAALSVYKGQLRGDVVRFARAKLEEVQNNLIEIQDREIKHLEQTYKSCQSMTVPSFKKKYEESLSRQLDLTVEFQLKLIEEFVSFLNDKLSVPEPIVNVTH